RLTTARTCVWNQRDEGRDRLSPLAERLAVRMMPYFIANSVHGAEFLAKELKVQSEKIRIVHNGVEPPPPERGRAEWRADLGVGDDCFLACMVANLQRFKDHVTLLRAWRIVVDDMEKMGRQGVLLLAGRFDQSDVTLKALAHELRLGKRVRFL